MGIKADRIKADARNLGVAAIKIHIEAIERKDGKHHLTEDESRAFLTGIATACAAKED